MQWNRPIVCLLAVVVVLAGLPLGASAALGGQAGDRTQASTAQTASNETVNVSVGQQLSTVLSTTSDDVQSEVESTEFELAVENDSDEARAEAIAARADQLSDRAESIREDYEEATEAYEEGEISKSAYAQRIAALNARAENVVAGIEQLEARSATVSEVELRAAGLNRTALRAASDDLDSVRGTGAEALLQRFTGISTGEVEIESENGLSIEVSGEDGEFSREIERARDDDDGFTVSQSAALESARSALSTPQNATWTLQRATIHEESGYYRFAFGFDTAARTGEAEVRVDGSSGEVFNLEEEIELTDDAEDEREADEEEREDDEREDDEDEREDDELALLVADGTVAPGETITVRASRNGESASNVTVSVNGETVGTTDADGTAAVTLPSTGEVEITAGEGELELEFEDDEDEVYRTLRADAAVANGTVTVTVTYDGSSVGDAVVFANDREVGTTDESGTVTFAVADGTEELEIDIVKGEFEAEFEYELRDGALVQTDGPDAGDDEEEIEEEAEAEDGEAETEEEDETEDDDAETETEEEETEEEESDDDDEETEEDDD